jgi:elongation factor 1-alpha
MMVRMKETQKLPKINLVTIGHKDHGKSTLIGRLLYDAGAIKGDKLKELENTAKKLGKKEFEFAFVLDQFQEERNGGLTIDIMHTPFQSKKFFYTIIDCPGHKEFIKNMLTGASNADAALFLISAKGDEGIQEQTKEHAWLIKVLGVHQIVVAISKMDAVDYSQERFNEISEKAKEMLKTIGYPIEHVPFVPISGLRGDNVFKKSRNMPWYNGSTLVVALDKKVTPAEPPLNKPLRVLIQDALTSEKGDTLLVGRVETGVLKVGDKVTFEPSGISGEVDAIEKLDENLLVAKVGDNIGFKIKDTGKKIRRGQVCGHLDNPPTVAKEFLALIIVLRKTTIKKGDIQVFRCGTANVPCEIMEIVSKVDPKSGTIIDEHPALLEDGEAGRMRVVPTEPMVAEKQSEIPQLGRFVVRDNGTTIAAGIILNVKQ